MKQLRLPLKKKWFEMTKAGIKTEDYREINDYWCRRLLNVYEEMEIDVWREIIDTLNHVPKNGALEVCFNYFSIDFVKFNTNTMILGYPKSTDTNRILKLEHNGIEIRTGNPEWGAEPNKLYFVIKHGRQL